MKVTFHDLRSIPETETTYVVMAARYRGRWILVRHKDRTTWEIPGGHREPGEGLAAAARRELHEETGALDFDILPVCMYSVAGGNGVSSGGLFYCEVNTLGALPELEIAEIRLVDDLPRKDLTYPMIQPLLFGKVREFLAGRAAADPTSSTHREGG